MLVALAPEERAKLDTRLADLDLRRAAPMPVPAWNESRLVVQALVRAARQRIADALKSRN